MFVPFLYYQTATNVWTRPQKGETTATATQSRHETAQHQSEKRDDTPEPQEIKEDKRKKRASKEL